MGQNRIPTPPPPPPSPFSYQPPPGCARLPHPAAPHALPGAPGDALWLLQLPPGWDTSRPLVLEAPPPGASPDELGRATAPDGAPVALVADHASAVDGACAWGGGGGGEEGGGGAPACITRRATLVRLGPPPPRATAGGSGAPLGGSDRKKKKKDREGRKEKKKRRREEKREG